MEKAITVFNIIDLDITIPGVKGVTNRRIDGDERVYQPVTAIFCSPKTFGTFNAIKRRIERLCLGSGTRLCGGYAVPDDSLDLVLEQVKGEQKKFEAAKKDLVACWPQPVEDWIASHPDDASAIRAIAPKNFDISAGLTCDVSVFKINPSQSLKNMGIEDGLEKRLGGVSRQIANEIAAEARNSWKNRQEKGSSTSEIRKGLKRWADKLKSLSFLDPVFLDVEKMIREGIGNLPSTGKITGHDFLVLSGLMAVLTNPDILLSGKPIEDIGIETPDVVPAAPVMETGLIGW